MTEPGPMPEPAGGDALFEQAVLWRRVTGELDAAVAGTAALAAEIAAFWTDRAGQGWAQRLDLVGRELDRQAGVAADIVRLLTAMAHEVGGPTPPAGPDVAGATAPDVPGPSWSLPGPRLGGTDGARASERRGVVVPTLPDQPGG